MNDYWKLLIIAHRYCFGGQYRVCTFPTCSRRCQHAQFGEIPPNFIIVHADSVDLEKAEIPLSAIMGADKSQKIPLYVQYIFLQKYLQLTKTCIELAVVKSKIFLLEWSITK